MDITPLIAEGRMVIQGTAPGMIRVNGTPWHTPVIVFPDRTVPWPGIATPQDAAEEDFAAFFAVAGGTEIALLGTGAVSAAPVPAALRRVFSSRRIALEVMDTGAACRTYNVLMAEGRQVAALLVPSS